MRKVFQSVLISIDGVTANAGAWAMPYFSEDSAADALAQLQRSDAMLFGRVSYEELAARWASSSGPFAQQLAQIKKYVFSTTIEDPRWSNTVVMRTNPVATVRQLKAEGDGDLTIYGHGQLAQQLLDADVIDETTFSIHPVIVGPAAPRMRAASRAMRLLDVRARRSGVLVVRYNLSGLPADAASAGPR